MSWSGWERAPRLFFCSRLPLLIFPVLTALLLWWWARQILSPAAAVVLAALFALEPTALGHAPLFKNDLAATFGFLLFWYAAWKYWRRPGAGNAAALGAALLVALLAKLSMLVLVPMAPLLVAARCLAGQPRRWRGAVLAFTLVVLIPYLGSIAAVQFETRRLQDGEFLRLREQNRMPEAFLFASNILRVVPYPVPLFDGAVSILQCEVKDSLVYFWGDFHPQGHPLYFVGALALKSPVPLQILLLSGFAIAGLAALRRRLPAGSVFWLFPPVLYVGMASAMSLQMGVRLVLPALPFGLLAAGYAVEFLRKGRRVAVLAVLLAAMAGTTAHNYPHGISYFNLWAGSPENGSRYLSDSNVDWGQNLPDLGPELDRLGISRVRLFYFGNDITTPYLRRDQVEELPPPWEASFVDGTVYRPQPGYYAVSASLLPGHFFEPEYRDYFRVFREAKPIGRAGYSIYIYQF